MKRFALALLTLALTTPAQAAGGVWSPSMVAAGCSPTPAAATRTVYVEPAKGSDTNAGTQAAPLKTFDPANVKAGDAWVLGTGKYGDVRINGLKLAGFAQITAAPNAAPVFSTLDIQGSSKWIVHNIKIMSQATPATAYTALANVAGGGASTNSDIVLDSLKISSVDSSDNWTQADWIAKGRWYGISVDGGDSKSSGGKCITLTNNTIRNVRGGIAVTANDTLVDNNTIQGFGDDALDFAGDRIVLHANRILDNHDLGDGNHNDGIQGQIGRGATGQVFDGDVIDGNVVIARHNPALKFPSTDLQGISAFDMDWSNLKVVNNIVVINVYHGISFYSVHHGLIANNVVISTDPAHFGTWLGVYPQSHQGAPSNDIVVRNNIVNAMDIEALPSVVTLDHNLVINLAALTDAAGAASFLRSGTFGDHNTIDAGAAAKVFKLFDVANAKYDFHIKTGSEADGTGNPVAPNDAAGKPRLAPVKLGAY